MDIERILDRLDNVRHLPSGYSARCPSHDDRVSSLMVNKGRTQPVVVHCHAGCTADQVMEALGMSTADLVGKAELEQRYEYVNADGSTAYVMQRWRNPKTFRAEGSLPSPADRVLYQLPAINWARSAGATVYIVEGEKDADRLISMGLVATTNVSGAGSWLPHYGKSLQDCHVVVVADTDDVGRAHARHVAKEVSEYAATVRLVTPSHGKDISDLLDAGYSLDDLADMPESEELHTYLASNVQRRKIEWAWTNYVPFGKLTIIEGDPGDGKSVLTIDLAARWSTGNVMPDGSPSGGPYRIMLVSAEDDPADTICPRLFVANARLDGVELVPHGSTPERPFEFAQDLTALEKRIRDTGARIVVFDPLTAFMSSHTDTHNDMQVRHALYPLKALAERTRAAVLLVRHLNKGGQGVKAIYRGNGSIAFTGAARVGFLVVSDPDEPQVKLLACVKSNLSAKPATMRYELESSPDGVPYVAWKGTCEIGAQDALDGPKKTYEIDEEIAAKNRARQYEMQFLNDILVDGPMSWNDIVAAGKVDGFSEGSLRRARSDIGLVKVVGDGGNRDAQWKLRDVADSPQSPFAHLLTEKEAKTRALNGCASEQMGASEQSSMTVEELTQTVNEALPICETCGETDGIVRCFGPWWTVRCADHLPEETDDENAA